jgi:hypothetical protein
MPEPLVPDFSWLGILLAAAALFVLGPTAVGAILGAFQAG